MKHLPLRTLAAGMLFLSAFAPTIAYAHLMVAQHGTLNFLDDSAYMVLSLPASAFSDADENNDGLLSIAEFSEHRKSIIDVVSKNVSLGNKNGSFTLNNIRVSPVTPHDEPKDPAAQIIAMGRFSISDEAKDLYFSVDLFTAQSKKRHLEITASRKSTNDKHVFELTPNTKKVKLNFN